MAGSINLSLSQQFDKLNGNLLSGGRLYFYAAGTDNPQNAFKDDGLTLVHPNPIILASDGRIPQLYFADGSIHVRLTDSGGVVQFDEDFVLVIGPSSGSGGGGGSGVDPNAIFQTGDLMHQPVGGARSGWVMCNGTTIGPVGSSASQRANADCQALFTYLWTAYAFDTTICPVFPARGTSAAADWSGGKWIGTLDCREIIMGGLSAMGTSADRGIFGSVPVERGGRTTPASIIGEIAHTLLISETPTHDHTTGTTDGENTGHTHPSTIPGATNGNATGVTPFGGSIWYGTGSGNTGDISNTHHHTFTTTSVGSGTPVHNTTPRIMLGTFYMKL
jgi:hypothetical protein